MGNKRDNKLNFDNSHNKNNNQNNNKKGNNKKNYKKTVMYITSALVLVPGLTLGAFYIKSVVQNNQVYTSPTEEESESLEEKTTQALTLTPKPLSETTDMTEIDTAGGVDNTEDLTEEISVIDAMKNSSKPNSSISDKNKETIDTALEKEESSEGDDTDDTDTRKPVKVRGIYVTGPMAGTENSMKDLIHLVDTTELNAMVIDIKNDSGEITYKMDLPEVKKIGADVNYIRDMEQLISDLKSKDIYLIARIVAFKDPILAENRPDLSIRNEDGTIFRDSAGLSWVNPYKKEVWDYLVSVAKEAANLGFDEIQFDYIRFSTDSKMKNADFGKAAKDKDKIDVISEFTKYASDKLKPLGVFVSADVYGTIIDNKVDADIVGQSYVEMSKFLDYICPMIYPSHYANGIFGIEHPDLEPYNVIFQALKKSKTDLEEIKDGNKAVVRPWLQDFTASWLDNHQSYNEEEIRAQIEAVYDTGYEEWILWNGKNHYTKEGLLQD